MPAADEGIAAAARQAIAQPDLIRESDAALRLLYIGKQLVNRGEPTEAPAIRSCGQARRA